MLKFKSQATADVILLESSAHQVLHIIGKEHTPQGIITVDQIPAAVAALRAAVEHEEHHDPAPVEVQPDEHLDVDHAKPEGHVSLRQRVAPFIDMLQRSAAEHKDVVWGV